MTERISSHLSGGVCRHPDDEQPEDAPREKAGASNRDRLVSETPIGWDDLASSCGANAVLAARSARGGGMSGSSPSAPRATAGSTSAPRCDAPPTKTQSAGASSNAARTTERDGLRPYFAAGLTHDGQNAFVGGAAVKGSMEGVIEAEVVSASVQAGLRIEAQATLARVGASGEHGSASVETLTAQAHAGIYNSDGSVGFNYGASAAFISSEITAKHSGNSITVGLAAGIGGGVHVGIRDDDKDGRPELCYRGSVGPFTVGGCLEIPVVIRP